MTTNRITPESTSRSTPSAHFSTMQQWAEDDAKVSAHLARMEDTYLGFSSSMYRDETPAVVARRMVEMFAGSYVNEARAIEVWTDAIKRQRKSDAPKPVRTQSTREQSSLQKRRL